MKRFLGLALACFTIVTAGAQDKWLSFQGKEGPGKGKHIVLVSGDEEYRSEESMPMLAKILSCHHGFDTTVLFSWSADGAYIAPNNAKGVLGVLEAGREKHPVLNSVKDILGPSDVYGVKHLTDEDTILLRGAVTDSLAPDSKNVEGPKNDPMMALAWLHTYVAPEGDKTGRALCTTMGASVDFVCEDLRPMKK